MNAGDGIVAGGAERQAATFRFPASFEQERIWYLERFTPERGLYNITLAWKLHGALDPAALVGAISKLVKRHEILRTTFHFVEAQDELVQEVHSELSSDLKISDGLLPDAVDAVRSAIRQLQTVPFDLARESPIRFHLLRESTVENALVVISHHIAFDGWSTGIFAKELAAFYNAVLESATEPMGEPSLQYGDYAAWQREKFAREGSIGSADFWREQLQGTPPLLNLPLDRPRITVGNSAAVDVDLEAFEFDIRRTCASERASEFMLFATLFGIVLHAFSGESDLCIGFPVATRSNEQLQELIGYVGNTSVLRVTIDPKDSIRSLLSKVRSRLLDVSEHAEFPFQILVQTLAPSRSSYFHPIFQVMLNVDSASVDTLALSGVEATPLQPEESSSSKFDLTLGITNVAGRRCGALAFNAGIFERSTVERMVDVLRSVMDDGLSHPTMPIKELLGRSDLVRRQAQALAAPATREQTTLHRLFEKRVRSSNGRTAVIFGDQSITYEALNSRANRLARHLRTQGVGTEDLVALCLERSIDMIVCMLAVLKAGAAYVPLDPAYPLERLSFTLRDARPKVMLTQRAFNWMFTGMPIEIVEIDGTDAVDVIQAEPSEDLDEVESPASDLAYVIYTSGSTGQPKGVMVEHRQVSRLFDACQRYFDFADSDCWSMFHSYAFDFSVWEIWGALTTGARLVIVPYLASRSPKDTWRLIVEHSVTILSQTPSAFRQLVADQPRSAHSIRCVVFGGEALELSFLKAWISREGNERSRLINMYGITETTVHVTYREVSRREVEAGGHASIGYPLEDLEVHLVDETGHHVPDGAIGEILVGGAGVARGYLNRPELTSQRFIRNPFDPISAGRLYRSGDLGRRLVDGTLEYLGRNDSQVKVRGFRIELGEIEAALACMDGVENATVLALPDASGESELVAYVVARPGTSRTSLRIGLKARLPQHMIPSSWVFLDVLPLTINGKVDREALPRPQSGVHHEASAPGSLSTATEVAVAEIWGSVLEVSGVAAHDDFFDLGGHSLKLIQVLNRIESMLGVSVEIQDAYRCSVLTDLAAHIDRSRLGSGSQARWQIERYDGEGRMPTSAQQESMWKALEQQPQGYNSHASVLTLAIDPSLTRPSIEHAIQRLIERHAALRSRYLFEDGSLWAELTDGSEIYKFVDLESHDREAFSENLAEISRTTQREVTRERAPLRIVVVRTHSDGFLAQLHFSQIAIDFWSLQILLRDVSCFLSNAPLPLQPASDIGFYDFAHSERAHLQSGGLELQREYWTRKLAKLPHHRFLPQVPRPASFTYHGRVLSVVLDECLACELRATLKTVKHSLFTFFLAASFRLESRYLGTEDVVVGSLLANRKHIESEGMVGLFRRFVVFRQTSPCDESWDTLMWRLRAEFSEILANSDVVYRMHLPSEITGHQAECGHRAPLIYQHKTAPVGATSSVIREISSPGRSDRNVAAPTDLLIETSEHDGQIEIDFVGYEQIFSAGALQALAEAFQAIVDDGLRSLLNTGHSTFRPELAEGLRH